jgi:hypothetical protein
MLPLNFKAISLIDWIEVLFISCDTGVGRSNTKILQIHDCPFVVHFQGRVGPD